MLTVYLIQDDEFLILSKLTPKPFHGDRAETVMRLEATGVETREIEEALFQLRYRGHNVAHFGVNLRFIYCEQILCDADLPMLVRTYAV